MKIREFLEDIITNEIIQGKKYSERIEIEDGGYNSYIGICVDIDDYDEKPFTEGVRLFRNTNTVSKITNTWEFELGGICYPYFNNPGIPLKFSSYGKTPIEAEAEAVKYFKELKKLIRKQTTEYKKEMAKSAEQERAELLARLAKLEEDSPCDKT